MKILIAVAALAGLASLWFLLAPRPGELRLKHIVTVSTPSGVQSFESVLSMVGDRGFGYTAGAGWSRGPVMARLTGSAVRVTMGSGDFYFLLANPRISTPPSLIQLGYLDKYFGFSRLNNVDWTADWNKLSASNRKVVLKPEDYPTLAMVPPGGSLSDARVMSLDEAEKAGLHIVDYKLEITKDAIAAEASIDPGYRHDFSNRDQIPRHYFSVTNGGN
jgi:hypothetical protein